MSLTTLPLCRDPHFTFRFAADRIIARFHLEGVEGGRCASIFKLDPFSEERSRLIATATVGNGGWVDLSEPIIVSAGEGFLAVPDSNNPPKERAASSVNGPAPTPNNIGANTR